MTLSAGRKLGPYEVVALIGAGGMGEVYKARDTRLDRIVAVKLLPADVADRPDRRLRFEAEARTVSSLSHPHICTLFDIGEQDGRAFLVMEYLEGETLDDRLTHGALPAADVVRCAVQIASALDQAHRERIVHRDLKPSNVMLTQTGAKLLDFGLARNPVMESAGLTSTLSLEHRRLTAEGTILGTIQYMAPEQLENKNADARTDIFALGTLLYEMATGRKAFEGKSQASLIASILTEHPPPISSTQQGKGLPSSLDHIVERCLAKNPDDRWQTARDVKLELEWIAAGNSQATRTRSRPRWHRREAIAWAVAVLATAAAAATAVRLSIRERSVAEVTRFVVTPPSGGLIGASENTTRMAISPDGRQLAFVATTNGQQRIWTRSLGSLTAQPLAGTDGAVSPFWSPDSRFIGFFASGTGELKKVDASGGPARTICLAQMDGAPAWGRDGTILFTQFLDGIYRVSGEGGTPTRVTALDKARHELNHYWPSFLPDGRHFMYLATALDANGVRVTPSIYVASLDSTRRETAGPDAFEGGVHPARPFVVRRARRPAGPDVRYRESQTHRGAGEDRRRAQLLQNSGPGRFLSIDDGRARLSGRDRRLSARLVRSTRKRHRYAMGETELRHGAVLAGRPKRRGRCARPTERDGRHLGLRCVAGCARSSHVGSRR